MTAPDKKPFDKPSKYLYEYVKKSVDLPNFLETQIGCNLMWQSKGFRAKTACPLHNESNPSFHLRYNEANGVWTFLCYGCGKSGTIIDFFKEYYNLSGSDEAVVLAFRRFNFKMDESVVLDCLKKVTKKIDLKEKMEYAHVVTANQCRTLLKKDYAKHSKWVGSAYRKLNKALAEEDITTVEGLGFEASKRGRL